MPGKGRNNKTKGSDRKPRRALSKTKMVVIKTKRSSSKKKSHKLKGASSPVTEQWIRPRASGTSSMTRGTAVRHMATIRAKAPVSQTAKAVMLPLIYAARFAAGWSTEATVIGRPFTIQAVDVTNTVPTTSTPPILNGGSYMVGISRDPLNAIMEYVPTPFIAWLYRYKMIVSTNGTGIVTPHIGGACLIETMGTSVPTVYKEDQHVGDTSKLHPFGPVSFCREARGHTPMKFSWIDASTDITFGFFSDLAATVPYVGSGTIEIMRWDGSAAVPCFVINYSAVAATTYRFLDSGNFCFFATPQVACYLTMYHASGAGPAGVISHRPIPGFLDQPNLTGIRVIGASVMVTPDCAELAKGGWAIGAQISDAYVPESFITNNSSGLATDTLANLHDSHGMDFSKGMYAWHRPLTNASFSMQRPIRFNLDYSVQAPDGRPAALDAVSNYVSYMDPPDGWTFIAVNTPPAVVGGSPNSHPGGLLHTTFAWSVEYCSNNVWLDPIALPPTRGEFDELMEALVKAPQFEENSFHVQQLLTWLRGELRHIGKEGNFYIKTFGPHLQSALRGALQFGDKVTGTMAGL